MKTPHHTPGRSNKSSKTPTNKKLNKSGSRKTPVADRFVPDRSNFEMAHYLLKTAAAEEKKGGGNGNSNNGNPGGDSGEVAKKENTMYSRSLTENMLGVADLTGVRVLSYTQKPKAPPEV
jgi:hypothetical protein